MNRRSSARTVGSRSTRRGVDACTIPRCRAGSSARGYSCGNGWQVIPVTADDPPSTSDDETTIHGWSACTSYNSSEYALVVVAPYRLGCVAGARVGLRLAGDPLGVLPRRDTGDRSCARDLPQAVETSQVGQR